jgi:hypothetical protein
MCKGFLALLFAFSATTLPAQSENTSANNAIYLELLGNGGLLSLNYDLKLRDRASFRVGFGAWTAEDLWSNGETTVRSVPVMLNHLRGSSNHRLETGAGLLLGQKTFENAFGDSETTSFISLTGTFGYRYQPTGGGVVFRAGLTPFFGFGGEESAYPDKGLLLSIGLSLGFAF